MRIIGDTIKNHKKLLFFVAGSAFVFLFFVCVGINISFAAEGIGQATAGYGASADVPPPKLGSMLGGVVDALAGVVMTPLVSAISAVVNGFLSMIFWFLTQILGVATYIFVTVLNWPPAGQSLSGATIVTTGVTIVTSVANMFFIVFLLIIAFATILGLESYNYKRLLWKLVLAALLINFSVVIAGPFIDFANVLTRYFINAMGGSRVGDTIQNSLKMEQLYQVKAGVFNPLSTKFEVMGKMFVAQLANIIFIMIAIVIMFAMAFMFLARIIALWILLILSPIAWIMWVLPATQSVWNKWWSSFFKWVFFAPVATFFIYLAVISAATINTDFLNSGTITVTEIDKLATSSTADSMNFTGFLLQFFVVIALLIASLIVGQSLGIAGAGAAMGILKKGGNMAKGELAYRASRMPIAREAIGWGRAKSADIKDRRDAIRSTEMTMRREDMARRSRGEKPKYDAGDVSIAAKQQVKTLKSLDGLSELDKRRELKRLAETPDSQLSRGERARKAGAVQVLSDISRKDPEKFYDEERGKTLRKTLEQEGHREEDIKKMIEIEKQRYFAEKEEAGLSKEELQGKRDRQHSAALKYDQKAMEDVETKRIDKEERSLRGQKIAMEKDEIEKWKASQTPPPPPPTP